MTDGALPATVEAIGWIDLGLHIAGGAVLLACGAVMLAGGGWRNPLAGRSVPTWGPTPLHLALVVATYLCGTIILSQFVLIARGRLGISDSDIQNGSAWWHLLLFAEHFAKICATIMALYFLCPAAAPHSESERLGPAGTLIWTLGGLLALVSLTTLQHHGVVSVSQWLFPDWHPPQHPVLEALTRDPLPPWGAIHLTLQATLVAGICEEVFFRGIVLAVLWRLSGMAWLSVTLTAAAFGLVHLSQPQTLLPLMSMGLIQGFVRVRSGSLLVCILIHVAFNARTMFLALLDPARLAMYTRQFGDFTLN